MITAIFFGGRFYVTLTEAAGKEQDLVDTLFPQVRPAMYLAFERLVGLRCFIHCALSAPHWLGSL